MSFKIICWAPPYSVFIVNSTLFREHLLEREKLEVSLSTAEKKSIEVLRTISEVMHVNDYEDTEKVLEKVKQICMDALSS